MEELLNRIKKASSSEIDLIFNTALRRKRELYPDWVIYYATVPKENKIEREIAIRDMFRFLEIGGEV